MLWFVLALIVVFGWGLTDMLYKMGTDEGDRDSFLKITIWVGIVMGLVSLALLPFSESGLPLGKLLVSNAGAVASSLCYIASMMVGYAGLRFLELSIISPVQNSSGGIAMVFMLLFFVLRGKVGSIGELMEPVDWFGVVLIIGGLVALAIVEQREAETERGIRPAQKSDAANRRRRTGDSLDGKYRMGALALIFPLAYCLLDAAGTGINGIILSAELGEIDNQIIYGCFFFLAAVCVELYLRIRRGYWYVPFRRKEKIRLAAGVTETMANIVYIYAMALNPVLAAPVISAYCIVSMLLGRVILKEKLTKKQYLCLLVVVIGILLLGISEGLKER